MISDYDPLLASLKRSAYEANKLFYAQILEQIRREDG